MPKPLPQIVLMRGGILVGDVPLMLRVRHREIVMKLATARGDLVPFSALIQVCWPNPDNEPADPVQTVTTEISKLRRRLEILGLSIRNEHGEGYRLVHADESKHAVDDVARLARQLGVNRGPVSRMCRESGVKASIILARIGER